MLDVVTVSRQEPDEQLTALVIPLPGCDTIRDRQDGGLQTGSFVFSTSATSVIAILESIAFAMS
jgi:hypothetical protein